MKKWKKRDWIFWLIKAVRLLLYTPADYRIKSCCATQPTFQRWLLLIVISPVWPTGVSGWKIAAPPGYRQALEEYGISPDPRWVISVPFNEEGGERAAHQLINSGLPLTAAVTFNDVMAAGIMRILHQRGVQLPQQLSIVGFDDVVLARYLYPALTTMHYPVEQMARCAAQLAIQLYQGITPPPSSNHFNAELVIRDSVAPYFSR